MKYKILLISFDNNKVEFETIASSAEEAIVNAYRYIEKMQWEQFRYSVKYIDTIEE